MNGYVAVNEPDSTVLRHLDLWACLAALVGIAGFAWLHLGFGDVVDPVRHPVSSYALDPVGEIGFAAGALGMAVACGALAVRFSTQPVLSRSLVGAAVMYVLVVVFPTDAGVDVSTVSGQIHRYAAGVAFVAMTLAAVATVRVLGRQRWVGFFAVASVALLLLTTVNTFLPELADGGAWRGVPQRLLLAVHLGFLLCVVIAARRVESGQGRVGAVTNGSPRWGVANWPDLMATWANSLDRDRRAVTGSDS